MGSAKEATHELVGVVVFLRQLEVQVWWSTMTETTIVGEPATSGLALILQGQSPPLQ